MYLTYCTLSDFSIDDNCGIFFIYQIKKTPETSKIKKLMGNNCQNMRKLIKIKTLNNLSNRVCGYYGLL